jgi:hypothetical protein
MIESFMEDNKYLLNPKKLEVKSKRRYLSITDYVLGKQMTTKRYLKIHLKSGAIVQVHVDDLDQFIVDNWDDLTTEKGERFGPARDVQGSYC